MLHLLINNAVATHIMPYLSTMGVMRSTASLVASATPLVSIIGRLGLSWLGDKVNRKLVVVSALAMMCIGLICFEFASRTETYLLIPLIVIFGIGYGGSMAQRAALVRDYFGRTYFGTIFGVIMGITMVGAIVGAPLTGWVYDHWGSYHGVWLFLAGIAVLSLVLIISISPVTIKSKPMDEKGYL